VTVTDQALGARRAGSVVPRRRTSFIGREAEVDSIVERLGQVPALTLLGVGGVGKTRLAYETASRIEAGGEVEVLVVELAATFDDDAVDRVVADALDLPLTADQAPADAVANRLAGSNTLLVLDNCEQVIDGAATLVDLLLDRCPLVTVLATSRVPLGVEGEYAWPVDPLRIDDGDDDGPAIQLLVERAQAAHPRALEGADHEQLAALARRLDGVPLALELAAARLGTLGLTDLLHQLDDRLLQLDTTRRGLAERHRSLAGVVEWSYRLLDDDERALAAGLSVFRGSFTREAAEEVLGLEDARTLDRLAEVSLLSVTGRGADTRLLMLEMIREFLADQLERSGRADELRRAHAAWAARLVRDLQPRMRSSDEAAAHRAFDAERANVGAAVDWAATAGEHDVLVDLARGLHDPVLASSGQELHAWIERAARTVWDDPTSGDALLIASTASMVRGDIPRYRELLEQADTLGIDGDEVVIGRELEWSSLLVFEGRVAESVEICRRLQDQVPEDPWIASHVLMRLAQPFAYGGHSREALALTERSVAEAERSGSPTARGWALYTHGEALMGIDPDAAIDSYHEALAQARNVDNTFLFGLLSVGLATAQARHGEPEESLRQFRETIAWWRDVGGWAFLSTTLRNFGEFLARLDRPEEAVLVRCALEHLKDSSEAGGVDADRDVHLRRQLTDRLGRDRFEQLMAESHDLNRDQLVGLALDTIDDELRQRTRTTTFRVIVFTDLESSTSFTADAGDADARKAMRQYDQRTDALLAKHRGERVKGTGDGVLATFSSVAEALACMVELARDIDHAVERGELPLRLRVGMHVGETITDMGDVYGTVVNLTARVVDRADGGEILVTDTIRQIVVGSTYRFTSLGEVELKGIPDPIRLHRLEWS
jgi:predicted ATPase/class 3 adenylate cyclase